MSSPRRVSAPRVSIFGLEQQYHSLNREYLSLSHRELQCKADFGGADSEDEAPVGERCVVISGVNFRKELLPLPDHVPLTTDSDTNKYAMLVWKMLDACESGSVGGDACRQRDVLIAATNDALAIQSPGRRFEHLLGLVLALANHGLRSFVLRSDPYHDQAIFTALGGALKKLFKQESIQSISPELRQWGLEYCGNLQDLLKSYGGKDWQGTGATKFAFNFGTAPAPQRVRKRKGETDEEVAARRAALKASKASK